MSTSIISFMLDTPTTVNVMLSIEVFSLLLTYRPAGSLKENLASKPIDG
ncbi:hypothetical protein [Flavobacterium sp.]